MDTYPQTHEVSSSLDTLRLQDAQTTQQQYVEDIVQNDRVQVSSIAAEVLFNQQFDTFSEAYNWYEEYAKEVGFGVRVRDRRKIKCGDIVSYTFVCAKEGKRDRKWKQTPRPIRKRKAKPETREGCPAKLRVNLDPVSSKWCIAHFVECHSHDLVPQEKVRFISNHRTITDADKAEAAGLWYVRIQTSKINAYLAHQHGGFASTPHTRKDLYNYLNKLRMEEISAGDAATMLAYLNCRSVNEFGFQYIHQEKEDNSLGNVLWSDATCRSDYLLFGEVVAFDSCYRRNMYNTPLVMLLGVNHHHQSIIFGGAILQDERKESYIWMLQTFIKFMGDIPPKAIVTDGDYSMRSAIKHVLPEATHRLCSWHVLRNVPPYLKSDEFLQRFSKCIMDRVDDDVFERLWNALLHDFVAHDNEWLRQTYQDRHMLAEAFMKDKFFAGFRTTSRCESMHSTMDHFLNSRMNLMEFIRNYEVGLSSIRNEEARLDHVTNYSIVVKDGCLQSFQQQAIDIYTHKSFAVFKKELDESAYYIPVGDATGQRVGDCMLHHLRRFNIPNQKRTVSYDTSTENVQCSCMLMESYGFPCRHIIAALVLNGKDKLPTSCFMRRWTKLAKQGPWPIQEINKLPPDVVHKIRYGALKRKCEVLCDLASKSDRFFHAINEQVFRLTRELQDEQLNKMWKPTKPENPYSHIWDPQKVRTKGMRTSNNSTTKKPNRCGLCNQQGHNRKTCHRSPKDEDNPSNTNKQQQEKSNIIINLSHNQELLPHPMSNIVLQQT